MLSGSVVDQMQEQVLSIGGLVMSVLGRGRGGLSVKLYSSIERSNGRGTIERSIRCGTSVDGPLSSTRSTWESGRSGHALYK